MTEGNRGVLEVYYDGWGFICDDGWSEVNADVACRILGYASAVSTNISYYYSDVNYKLDYVSCSGYEIDILECYYILYSYFSSDYCSSSNHIYINCGPGRFIEKVNFIYVTIMKLLILLFAPHLQVLLNNSCFQLMEKYD